MKGRLSIDSLLKNHNALFNGSGGGRNAGKFRDSEVKVVCHMKFVEYDATAPSLDSFSTTYLMQPDNIHLTHTDRHSQ